MPQINWETYSGTIEDFSQFGLLHQHNTRHSAVPDLEKGTRLPLTLDWNLMQGLLAVPLYPP